MYPTPMVMVNSNRSAQEPLEPSITAKEEQALSAGLCRRRQQPPQQPLPLEKAVYRHSLASQYSSTSGSGSSQSHRYSVGSVDSNSQDTNIRRWSGESDTLHVSSPTTTSFASLPPSSRFLLSGATSSETFREQELSRFYPTSRIKALSDPFVTPTMPSPVEARAGLALPYASEAGSNNNSSSSSTTLDPWCMSVKVALENAICSNWLYKYDPPSSSIASFVISRRLSWKRRFVVLVDRIVYIFKSDSKSTHPAREYFLLTDDTLCFASEEFSNEKKGYYVLELRKPLFKWYLRYETAAEMQFWMEAMKKIVAYTKLGHRGETLSASMLATLKLTDDSRLLTVAPQQQQQQYMGRSISATTTTTTTTATKAKHRPATLRASLPPTLPSTTNVRNDNRAETSQWWNNYEPFADKKNERRSSTPPTVRSYPTSDNLKRQSLARIPDWERVLPPQMPPPRSSPPPVPSSSLKEGS